MTMRDLADLVTVMGAIRTIINSSGLNRFSKEQIVGLRNKLQKIENKFVDECLNLKDEEKSFAGKLTDSLKDAQKDFFYQGGDSASEFEIIAVQEKLDQQKLEKKPVEFKKEDDLSEDEKLLRERLAKEKEAVKTKKAKKVADKA